MALEPLSFAERRVLGVLIEKGYTTPDQYPLSLNSVVTGSNQKSCRDPPSSLDEEAVFNSLDSLRRKGYTTLVRMEGSRVDRWKHRAGETLGLEAKEMALLAELFLRGPQTDGELRQRASRMVPIDTLEEANRLIEGLRSRPNPLVERLTPPGRKRGVKYAHALYPPSERPKDEDAFSSDEESFDPSSVRSSPTIEPALQRREERWTPPSSTLSTASQPPPSEEAVSGSLSGNAYEELKREIKALKERVEELEATFVKFLR